MLSTVSLSVKNQLEDKWAAAFYEPEGGIPFEVASLEAFRDAVEDTARLVRMPDVRFELALTGLGALAGNLNLKVGSRRLHEPTPEGTWWPSPRRCGCASKSASKVRCTCPLS